MTHGHSGHHHAGGYVYYGNAGAYGYGNHCNSGYDPYGEEKRQAPTSSNNKLVWQWNEHRDEFNYDGLKPEMKVSSTVSDYIMQDFFAELKTVPDYHRKNTKKKCICWFFVILTIWMAVIGINLAVVLTEEYWQTWFVFLFIVPTAIYSFAMFYLFCGITKTCKIRAKAMKLVAQKFTNEKLKPWHPACVLEVSEFTSYISLTDLTIPNTEPYATGLITPTDQSVTVQQPAMYDQHGNPVNYVQPYYVSQQQAKPVTNKPIYSIL